MINTNHQCPLPPGLEVDLGHLPRHLGQIAVLVVVTLGVPDRDPLGGCIHEGLMDTFAVLEGVKILVVDAVLDGNGR